MIFSYLNNRPRGSPFHPEAQTVWRAEPFEMGLT